MENHSINDSTVKNITCAFASEPLASKQIRRTLIAIVLFASLIGNIMVLRAISTIRGRKSLVYLLVANLAYGELGQVVVQPFILYYEETWHQSGWSLGQTTCKIIPWLSTIFLSNTTLTLAAIAVYRCLIMYSPSRSLSPFHSKILLTSFWCVAIGIGLPQTIIKELAPCPAKPTIKNCCFTHDRNAFNIYTHVWNVVVQYVPLATMVIAYSVVVIKIRRHVTNKDIIRYQVESSQSSTQLVPLKTLGQPNTEREEHPRNSVSIKRLSKTRNEVVELENNLLKMMYLIVASFIICYIPYPILLVLYHYGMVDCWKHAYALVAAMYFMTFGMNLPGALHPLFYGTKSKFFAKAFWHLVSCK